MVLLLIAVFAVLGIWGFARLKACRGQGRLYNRK